MSCDHKTIGELADNFLEVQKVVRRLSVALDGEEASVAGVALAYAMIGARRADTGVSYEQACRLLADYFLYLAAGPQPTDGAFS